MARVLRNRGFSLVEMLVALLFVGILMAGMANIFRSSLGNIAASGEGISALRRNRVSVDLLYDDLNNAGLFLNDLSIAPRLGAANPVFYVTPNVPIQGAGAGDPAMGDQLFCYMDMPLPFEGSFKGSPMEGQPISPSASQLVAMGTAQLTPLEPFYEVDCHNDTNLTMLREGDRMVFMDAFEVVSIGANLSTPGDGEPGDLWFWSFGEMSSFTSGVGPVETVTRRKHLVGSRVMFFRPAQMVRYSIKLKFFDPQKANGVPCLVRDQGNYDPNGFNADDSLEAIVAENVSGFKIYLSADSGQTWAGYGQGYTGFNGGWLGGLQAELNSQLAKSGRPGYQSINGNDNWIRSTPILVRADITTRSAMQRTENRNQAAALTLTPARVYKEYTQSLVMVPRHFGLPFN